jgi:hypothetical protein
MGLSSWIDIRTAFLHADRSGMICRWHDMRLAGYVSIMPIVLAA